MRLSVTDGVPSLGARVVLPDNSAIEDIVFCSDDEDMVDKTDTPILKGIAVTFVESGEYVCTVFDVGVTKPLMPGV